MKKIFILKHLNKVLDIHNSSSFPIYYLMNNLNNLGYVTDFDCGISRTMVYSDCPKKVADVIISLVSDCDIDFIDEYGIEEKKWKTNNEKLIGGK